MWTLLLHPVRTLSESETRRSAIEELSPCAVSATDNHLHPLLTPTDPLLVRERHNKSLLSLRRRLPVRNT